MEGFIKSIDAARANLEQYVVKEEKKEEPDKTSEVKKEKKEEPDKTSDVKKDIKEEPD